MDSGDQDVTTRPVGPDTNLKEKSDDKQPKSPNKLRCHKSPLKIIILSAVALIIVAGAITYATGYLYAGFKSPAQKAIIHNPVCGDDVQAKFFNERALTEYNLNKLKDIKNDVSSRKNWDRDPNCLLIVFAYATLLDVADKPLAQETFDKVKNLDAQGLSPSGRYFNYNLTAMEIMMRMVPGGIEGPGNQEM